MGVTQFGQGTGASSRAGADRRIGSAVDGPDRSVLRTLLPLSAGLWHSCHQVASLVGIRFPADVRVPYSRGMESWRPFLRQLIEERGIRHIFMYGDFIIPTESPLKRRGSSVWRPGCLSWGIYGRTT